MKLKKGLKNSTSDFWYDLTEGGYLKPLDMCESAEEAKEIEEAIKVIKKFETSCEAQIKDFLR